MMKRLTLAFIAVLFLCCTGRHTQKFKGNVAEYNPNVDTSALVHQCATIIKQTDRNFHNIKSGKLRLNGDSITIEVAFDSASNSAKRMTVLTKSAQDEGHIFIEKFYLDNINQCIIFVSVIDSNDISYVIVRQDRSVFSYVEQGKKVYVNSLDSVTKESKISAIMLLLDTYINSLYPFNYFRVTPSINSIPVLTALRNIELRSNASINSPVIMKLEAGTHFFYLDFAKGIDTVDAGKWVWYKVTTSDKKKTGWLYGSPNDVEPLTDDNW